MTVAYTVALDLRKAVISGLRTHFAGLADFNGSTSAEDKTVVSYGFTFGSNATEQVYLGRQQADTPPAGMRSTRNIREESGTFDLNVQVRKPGASVEEAEERLFAIGAEIEDWLSLRKSGEGLGVTGLKWLLVTSWASDYAGIDSGSGALLTYTLSWNARLEGTP